MQALQQRLELASLKTSHGWKDLSIGEIESTLPPPLSPSTSSLAARRGSSNNLAPIRVEPYPRSPAAGPSSAMHPKMPNTAPARYEPPSPSRPWQLMDVLWQPLPPPSSPRKRSREEHQHHKGHRRASSGTLVNKVRTKDRSYSHSTTADVNAAKALAFMHAERPLPLPHRSSSTGPHPSRAKTPDRTQEDDANAAELMMFLAHSPSPLRPTSNAPRPSPSTGRVLFDERKSKLAAPPITADFGGFL